MCTRSRSEGFRKRLSFLSGHVRRDLVEPAVEYVGYLVQIIAACGTRKVGPGAERVVGCRCSRFDIGGRSLAKQPHHLIGISGIAVLERWA
jgi:hypothetical protein